MFYTIMYLKSFGGEYSLDLNKNGNKYQIYFQWREDGDICKETKSMHEDYKTIEEAISRYQIGVELIAKSEGDFYYKCGSIFG